MNKIIPLDDNVLVSVIEPTEERTPGGLYIPEKARDNHRDARIAKVLAVGPGRKTEYGATITVTVQEGDLVLIPRVGGTQVESSQGEKLRLIRCVELLAKVEESRLVSL